MSAATILQKLQQLLLLSILSILFFGAQEFMSLRRLPSQSPYVPFSHRISHLGTDEYFSAQSSEYLALKARLQAAAEEEAYKRLLSPPSTAPGPSPIFSPSAGPSLNDADADADNDNDPLTPSLVLNIFLSVLLCGFSTFWALTNFQTPAFLSFARAKPVTGTAAQAVEPAFVLISIFAGLLVGVAEVAVYAAYLRKVRQARKKEKATKERKVVVGTVGDGDGPEKRNKKLEKQTATDDDSVGEKEEIWGRGVNGGVRRRVRERWRADNNDGI